MRATIEFLEKGFDKFNKEIFDNELPIPTMRISSARSFVGQFKVERTVGLMGVRKERRILSLSDRYDFDETALEDVLIHEMIHFMIHYRKIRDTSSHGKTFIRLMNEINRKYGRHITVSHRCSKEQLESDRAKVHSIVCLCTTTDGRKLACKVSQSKVFEIHRAFMNWDLIEKEEWFWVYGHYFNRFRKVLTPRLFAVDEEGIGIIESGTRLEFVEVSGGRTILRPAGPILR